MTVVALGRHRLKRVVHVAFSADDGAVRAGQRKSGEIMIEPPWPAGCADAVACAALYAESGRDVVRRVGCVILLFVACDARNWRSGEPVG